MKFTINEYQVSEFKNILLFMWRATLLSEQAQRPFALGIQPPEGGFARLMDEKNWQVLRLRWYDLHAQLHAIFISPDRSKIFSY